MSSDKFHPPSFHCDRPELALKFNLNYFLFQTISVLIG